MDTDLIGRSLLVLDGLIALVGLLFLLAPRVPFIGRLPGDISIERDGFSFFFPLATMLLVSLILTVVLNVIVRLK